MEEVYAIASRRSRAAGEGNKAHYDLKLNPLIYSLTIESPFEICLRGEALVN